MLTKKMVTGKRKTSIARIQISDGKGEITVNGRAADAYFKRSTVVGYLKQPLVLTEMDKRLDVHARLNGGGLSGQAGALRHAIAKAVDEIEPKNHRLLKSKKLLTRDDRKVERKLFGHKKARKSFQFSKR